MSSRSWASAKRIAILLVLAVIELAACAGDDPIQTPEGSSGPTTTGSPGTEVEGRILFSRIMPTGEFLHFVVETDGTGETPFAPGREFEARNLSPDGSMLAISALNERGLFVGGTIGVDGTGYRLFASADPSLNLVCGVWAPKERMACEGWDDSEPSRAGIYTVRASDGSDARRLTRHRDIPCEYSPDGKELAFIRTTADDGRGTLMLMDAAGDTRSLLADVVLTGIPCDWSPDGNSILAASDGALQFVTLDGDSSPLLGDGIAGYAMGGLWSPDGSHVLFSMTLEDQRFDVYTAAADGSDLTRLADSELLEESANWLPPASPTIDPAALEGTWETDTITAAEIRAVVLDAGFTREDAAQVIAGTHTFRFALRFEDGLYELNSSWDGKDVGVVEDGGYRITKDDRLLLDTGAIGDTFLFALDVRGDRFTMELLSNTETGTAEDKHAHSYFTTAFFTGHTFTRSD